MAQAVLARVRLASLVEELALPYPVEFSCGMAEYPGVGLPNADSLLEEADGRMYQDKRERRRKPAELPLEVVE